MSKAFPKQIIFTLQLASLIYSSISMGSQILHHI
jgi:hypothetical protein